MQAVFWLANTHMSKSKYACMPQDERNRQVEERMMKFRAAFDALDLNKDGVLDAEEYAKQMLEAAGVGFEGKIPADRLKDLLAVDVLDDAGFEALLKEMMVEEQRKKLMADDGFEGSWPEYCTERAEEQRKKLMADDGFEGSWPEYCTKRAEERMPQFCAAFDTLDTNKDGMLDAEELASYAGSIDDAIYYLSEAGKDEDGKMSARELMVVLEAGAMDDEGFKELLEEMEGAGGGALVA